jgi:hypothetical protein
VGTTASSWIREGANTYTRTPAEAGNSSFQKRKAMTNNDGVPPSSLAPTPTS